MKKSWVIIVVFIVFAFFPMNAKAKVMLVEVMNDFSSKNPPTEYSIIILKKIHLKKGHIIEKGSIVHGEITQVLPPKRPEIDAYFVFVADSYTIPSENNKIVPLNNKINSKIKYHKAIEPAEMAANGGIMAITHLVPVLNMVAPIVQFSIGVATPEEGESRIHSGWQNIAKSWPICFCLKGKEIDISTGDKAKFWFSKKMFEQ